MAQTIQIKRSNTTVAPSTLLAGEIAYSSAAGADKLYIGHPDGTTGNVAIGGQLYVGMLDHTAGTLTASSAVIVNSSSHIDVMNIGTLRIDVSGGSGQQVTSIETDTTFASPTNSQLVTATAVKTYVDTQLSASDLDFAGDTGTGAVDLDSQSFTIAGTASEIETVASGQTITIGLPDNINISGNAVIEGNLTVSGTTTTINTEELLLADNIIVLNSNMADSPQIGPTEDAGIEIERGTSSNVLLRWNETAGTGIWEFTNDGSIYHNMATDSDIVDAISGGTNTNVTVTDNGTTANFAVSTATDATLGVAKFNATEFTVTAGDVAITALDGGTY